MCRYRRHAGFLSYVEHVLRGHPVEAVERDPAEAALADDPDQVHQGGAPLHGAREPVRGKHVAGNAVDRLEAAQGGLGARPDEAADQEAVVKEGVDDGTTDEPGGPGDEDPLHSGAS